MSHPMWVRGLKLKNRNLNDLASSRTLCGCVDWNFRCIEYLGKYFRRTLCGCVDWNTKTRGATIFAGGRTLCGCVDWNMHLSLADEYTRSHPMWVRGLKHSKKHAMDFCWRRTLCGCVDWNYIISMVTKEVSVAPYVGAWIETSMQWTRNTGPITSHPMWVRGLKLYFTQPNIPYS